MVLGSEKLQALISVSKASMALSTSWKTWHMTDDHFLHARTLGRHEALPD
jgi:hypothetical protein